MNNQFWTISFDHRSSSFLTEHMNKISSTLESRDGSEVWSSSVEDTTSEHCDPPALSLPHGVGQLGNYRLHLLKHLRLLGADGGALVTSENMIISF